MDRFDDFLKIKKTLCPHAHFSSDKVMLAEGDSLELLREIPDHCVSLILTDPPYHATKKENIFGDTAFKEDKAYVTWIEKYAEEWYRVLKPNGSFFCFCSSAMSAQLQLMFFKRYNLLAEIVWTKPNDPGFDGWKQKMKKTALRQWYPHSERIIFAEPAFEGNLFRSYFGNVLREKRKLAGLTHKELIEEIGEYGRVNHGGAMSNWEAGRNVPSPEQYAKICKALIGTGKVDEMPPYEDLVRTFKMDSTKEFTDVWDFASVRPYKGKHPAEKPIKMLEHMIEATTHGGDIVLDCFSGSGSTGLAAMNLCRYAVLMEIDPKWVTRSCRILESKAGRNEFQKNSPHRPTTPRSRRAHPSLFSEPE